MIPAQAVDAAAKVVYELDYGPTGWDGLPDRPRTKYMDDAKAILEAAAPYMLAEARNEGRDTEVDRGRFSDLAPNPYRPTP